MFGCSILTLIAMHRLPALVVVATLTVALSACHSAPERSDPPRTTASDTGSAAARQASRAAAKVDTIITDADSADRGEGPLYPFGVGQYYGQLSWGFRTADGRVVIPPRFAHALGFHEKLAAVRMRADSVPRLEEGSEAPPDTLRWGYINEEGQVLIPPRLDGAGDFIGGRALVKMGEDLVFIDRTGKVVGRLFDAPRAQDARAALSAPCDSCGPEEYAKMLGTEGPERRVESIPYGEARSTFFVTHHPHGVISIREGGWEGASYTIRIPGITLEQGISLARRICGLKETTPTPSPDHPGELVLYDGGGLGDGRFCDEVSVRRRQGAVEITGALIGS